MAVAANLRRLLGAFLAHVALFTTNAASHSRSIGAIATSVAFLATGFAGAIEWLARLSAIRLVMAWKYNC